MNRRGLTLIELLVVLTIIGILANFAVPALGALRRRAEAARIIGDLHAIRVAALDHYVAFAGYPAAGQWGVVPPALTSSLPGGFAFQFRDVQYRWERWELPDGLPGDPSQTELPGLTVRAPDVVLMAALRSLFKGQVTFGSATEITFLLE